MRNQPLSPRDQRMLELLSQGLSNMAIAKRLGYKHGTTRVYLHGLYRKLGVIGKTAAVVWYIDHLKVESAREADVAAAALSFDETVGDLALRTDLYTALGAMNLFLGPYGKLWQVAARLKGGASGASADVRRQSRGLWEAFLKGDFAYGKRLHDAGTLVQQLLESPADGLLLALLLLFGGYSRSAGNVTSQLARLKRGTHRVPARDLELLDAARGAVEARQAVALERIYRVAMDAPTQTPGRHIAMAALYHAYRAHDEPERARGTADALWAEAEASRQHLQAMGEHPLIQSTLPPKPATPAAKDSTPRRRETLAAR